MKTEEELLEQLQVCGILQGEEDGPARWAARQAKSMIFSYCRIPWQASVPERLFPAWAALAGHLLQEGEGRVSSLTEGDVRIDFAAGEDGSAMPAAVKVMLAGDRRLF